MYVHLADLVGAQKVFVRQGFMNFIQIGKYKANFVDFVILSSRLEITTNKKLN